MHDPILYYALCEGFFRLEQTFPEEFPYQEDQLYARYVTKCA